MTDYKLLPEEATPEMEQAAEKYWNDRKFKALSDDPRTWKGLYAAMRAAAPAVQGEPEYGSTPQYINDAIDNLAHANYELSYAGYQERTRDVELIRAYVARAAQPAEQQPAPDAVEIGPNDLIVQLWSSRTRSQWDYSWDRGVKITHVPSGITVTCDTERSLHANKNKAWGELQLRLAANRAPDVAGLVEALVACARASSAAEVGLIVDAALAAYRKGGEA